MPCTSIINQLKEVNHQRYLGIIFDKKLCWDYQANDVCKWVAYYLHSLSIHQNSDIFHSQITHWITKNKLRSTSMGPAFEKGSSFSITEIAKSCCSYNQIFDQVSIHRRELHQLPVPDVIKLQSVAAMFHYYTGK